MTRLKYCTIFLGLNFHSENDGSGKNNHGKSITSHEFSQVEFLSHCYVCSLLYPSVSKYMPWHAPTSWSISHGSWFLVCAWKSTIWALCSKDAVTQDDKCFSLDALHWGWISVENCSPPEAKSQKENPQKLLWHKPQ